MMVTIGDVFARACSGTPTGIIESGAQNSWWTANLTTFVSAEKFHDVTLWFATVQPLFRPLWVSYLTWLRLSTIDDRVYGHKAFQTLMTKPFSFMVSDKDMCAACMPSVIMSYIGLANRLQSEGKFVLGMKKPLYSDILLENYKKLTGRLDLTSADVNRELATIDKRVACSGEVSGPVAEEKDLDDDDQDKDRVTESRIRTDLRGRKTVAWRKFWAARKW